MSDNLRNLQRIAEASRRPDGTHTPMSEQLTEAASELERLRELAAPVWPSSQHDTGE